MGGRRRISIDGTLGRVNVLVILILIISSFPILGSNEVTGSENTWIEEEPQMGDWNTYFQHPNEVAPLSSRSRMMFREQSNEMVFFMFKFYEGVQVWSYFIDNTTWIHWETNGAGIDHNIEMTSFVSNKESSKAYFFGGYSGFGGAQYFSDLNIFHYDNKTWTVADPTDGPGPRYGSSITFVDATDSLLIFGGYQKSGSSSGYSNEIWKFNEIDGWGQFTVNGPAPEVRAFSTMCTDPTDERSYIALGEGYSGHLKDLWQFNITDSEWYNIQNDMNIQTDRVHIMQYREDMDDLILVMGMMEDHYSPIPVNLSYAISIDGQGVVNLSLPRKMGPMVPFCYDLNEAGDKIVIAGGSSGFEMWSLDLSSLTVEEIPGSIMWSTEESFTGFDPDNGGRLYVLEQFAIGYGMYIPRYERWTFGYFSIPEKIWYTKYIDPETGPDNASGMAGCYDPVDNKFYLFGGGVELDTSWDPDLESFDGFWSFDVDTEEWVHIAESTLPGPRGWSEMVIDYRNGDIYIIGQREKGQSRVNGTLFKYDISELTWEAINGAPDDFLTYEARLVQDPKENGLYLYNGRNNELWFFHYHNKTWEKYIDVNTQGWYIDNPGLAVDPKTEEVTFYGKDLGKVLTWRPGWESWKVAWDGISFPLPNLGFHFNEDTETIWAWSLGSIAVREFKPISRTSVDSIKILDPEGKETDEVFAFNGNYTMKVSGTMDDPAVNHSGARLNISWGDEKGSILIDEWGGRPKIYGILPIQIPFMMVDLNIDGNDWWFEIPFALKIGAPDNQSFNLTATPIIEIGAGDDLTIIDLFTTHTGLDLGEFDIETEWLGEVQEGDWIPKGDNIYLKNISLEYKGFPGLHPRNNTIRIYFNYGTRHEGRWDYIQGETGEIMIQIEGYDDQRLEFNITVTDTSNNEIMRTSRYFFLDATPPPGINNLRVHADSYNDNNYYDDDHEVFVTWTLVDDPGSGLMEYRYCLDKFDSQPYNITYGFFSLNITEVGKHRIWLWAIDKLGLPGNADMFDFWIDTEPVEFLYLDLQPGVLFNASGNTHDLIVWVRDDVSGVGMIQYRQTVSDGVFSEWMDVTQRGPSNLNTSIILNLQLGMNYTNQIQFRAEDLSRNGVVESGIFQINGMDPNAIALKLLDPPNFDYAYGSVLLRWKMTPSTVVGAHFKVHMISPDGSDLVYETDNTYFTANIEMEGTWRWSIEVVIVGYSFTSDVRAFRSISTEMDISIPTKIAIEKGNDIVIPVVLRNDLDIELGMEITKEDGEPVVVEGLGNHDLGPSENLTVNLMVNTSFLNVGIYPLHLMITDDFGRTSDHSIILEIELDDETIRSGPKKSDTLFWLLVILSAIVIMIGVGVTVFFFYSKTSAEEGMEE